MEMRLELVPVPVSDVDKAIEFYVKKVGFNLDVDVTVQPGLRFVQLTPPGSACSIMIGEGVTEMKPGSQKGLQVVVQDAAATRDHLRKNGIDASELDHQDWGIFTYFSDPDGNTWAMQQMPTKEELEKYEVK